MELATEVAALTFFTWLVKGAADIVLRQSIGSAAPRADWLAKLPASPKLHAIQLAEPRDFVPNLRRDDFVLCMTMGHKTDRPLLQAMLESRFIHLPVSRQEDEAEEHHSRSKNGNVLERLLEDDIEPSVHVCRVSYPPEVNPIVVNLESMDQQSKAYRSPIRLTW